MPLDIQHGRLDDKAAQNVFTKKGKMIRYAKGGRPEAPENTTINAVIVTGQYPIGQKSFLLSADEFHDEAERPERYGADDQGRITRIFAGVEVAAFESPAM